MNIEIFHWTPPTRPCRFCLTDAQGTSVDFRNTILVMTSNLAGSATPAEKRRLGFGAKTQSSGASSDDLDQALRAFFRPELLNRIGCVARFRQLGREDARGIIDRIFARIAERAADRGVTLTLGEGAHAALLDVGFDVRFGARELERVMDRQILQPLARGMLERSINAGDALRVVAGGDGVVLAK